MRADPQSDRVSKLQGRKIKEAQCRGGAGSVAVQHRSAVAQPRRSAAAPQRRGAAPAVPRQRGAAVPRRSSADSELTGSRRCGLKDPLEDRASSSAWTVAECEATRLCSKIWAAVEREAKRMRLKIVTRCWHGHPSDARRGGSAYRL